MSAIEKEKIAVECLKNMSLFAARDKVNVNIPDIDKASTWMKKQFMPEILPATPMFDYAERNSAKDADLKAHLIDFLKEADFNISNVITKVINEKIPEKYIEMFLGDEDISGAEKDRLKREKTIPHYETTFEHTVENTPSSTDEQPAEQPVQNVQQEPAQPKSMDDMQKQMILDSLRSHNNKRALVAAELGISERTLYRKLKEYGIS